MQLKREIKFETLKKSHKKQIIIGSVLVCVVGSILTFNLTRAKYRLTQSMKLVTGTINYKVPDMRVIAVNMSEDGTNYEIANDIPESGYTLNEGKSICKVATETSGIENAPKDNDITIEYVNGLINFRGITKRSTRCYLYFDKKLSAGDTIITGTNKDYIKEGDPDFTKVATGAEIEEDNGIYKTSDPIYGGESYYWRGAATTNYVKFAGFCWRIIRINGDGSIRLIYDGVSCHINGTSTSDSTAVTRQKYSTKYARSEYVGYTFTEGFQRPTSTAEGTASNLKTQTDAWYNNNIENNATYAEKVADGKFCNDRNIASGYTWTTGSNTFYYASYERLYNNKKPTLSCDVNDIYTLKVGLITADEVAMAGGVNGLNNKLYYLYNGQFYWTMTPSAYCYQGSTQNRASMFIVYEYGYLSNKNADNYFNIRPVINLRSDITFNSGSDGTQNNPYIVQ